MTLHGPDLLWSEDKDKKRTNWSFGSRYGGQKTRKLGNMNTDITRLTLIKVAVETFQQDIFWEKPPHKYLKKIKRQNYS